MRKGQLITTMEGGSSSLPKRITVYTSDAREVGLQYNNPWETIVIDAVANKGRPEFGDYVLHAKDIEERALHHYHVVREMEKMGYRAVSHHDEFKERKINEEYEALMEGLNAILTRLVEQHNIKTWNKRLEGIPSLEFTPEELNRLTFLRYLHEQKL
ncbi:MAG: hypothetical protein V1702_05685 [Candidatus Woesearchaeota archaeon]